MGHIYIVNNIVIYMWFQYKMVNYLATFSEIFVLPLQLE